MSAYNLRLFRLAAMALCAPLALLAACGGGGGSSAIPTSATQTPALAQWLPGLSVDDITGVLEARGFTCALPEQGGGRMSWQCTFASAGGTVEETVSFLGNNATQIALINASVFDNSASSSIETAADFLRTIASIEYDGGDPPRAAQWVTDNIVQGGDLTAGSARFTLTAVPNGNAWTLDIVAAAPTG